MRQVGADLPEPLPRRRNAKPKPTAQRSPAPQECSCFFSSLSARNVRKHASNDLRKEKEKNHDDCRQSQQRDCSLALTCPATHPTIDLEKSKAKKDDREC